MICTTPSFVEMSSLDSPFSLEFDATPMLTGPGEVVYSAEVTMTDTTPSNPSYGDEVEMSGPSPSTTETSVTVKLIGTDYQVNHTYRLAWVVTLSTGDTLSEETTIAMVY